MEAAMSRIAVIVWFALTTACAFAQTPSGESQLSPGIGTGSISGHVMVDDAPASGVLVLLAEKSGQWNRGTIARTRTDQNGLYRFGDLRPGSYEVTINGADHRFVPANDSSAKVLLNADQNLEGLDFALLHSGAVTGRVVDSAGRPAVGAILDADQWDGELRVFGNRIRTLVETDDRGAYRLFGLPAGQYTISVQLSFTDRTPTYYPGTRDSQKASKVQVVADLEASNVDIVIGSPEKPKGYTISGHVIDVDTGEPVPNVDCYAENHKGQDANLQIKRGRTDSSGYFVIREAQAGTYSVSALGAGYSDPISVTVGGADITSVRIPHHKAVEHEYINAFVTAVGSNTHLKSEV
jgi:5-hydroxyisourate hydrolase-like protein (transthyretin family)